MPDGRSLLVVVEAWLDGVETTACAAVIIDGIECPTAVVDARARRERRTAEIAAEVTGTCHTFEHAAQFIADVRVGWHEGRTIARHTELQVMPDGHARVTVRERDARATGRVSIRIDGVEPAAIVDSFPTASLSIVRSRRLRLGRRDRRSDAPSTSP